MNIYRTDNLFQVVIHKEPYWSLCLDLMSTSISSGEKNLTLLSKDQPDYGISLEGQGRFIEDPRGWPKSPQIRVSLAIEPYNADSPCS